MLAFKTPDDRLVLIVLNDTDGSKKVELSIDARLFFNIG